MMKTIPLTAPQIAAIAPLKATLTSATAAYQAARTAYEAELASIATAAGVTVKHPRLMVSDDGNTLIAQ